MTKKINRALMELDLDSFLQLQSSDDEDDLEGIPHRTVDEILNDSDSSSSSSSSSSFISTNLHQQRFSKDEIPLREENYSVCSSETPLNSRISTVDETINSPETLKLEEKLVDSKLNSFSRRQSGEFSGNSLFLGRRLSSPLPQLFGSVKPNPKPGAALAAAAAASRPIPTPHWVAIKTRRANSIGTLQKVLNSEELVSLVGDSESRFVQSSNFDGLASSDDVLGSGGFVTNQFDINFGEGDAKAENLLDSSVESLVVESHSDEAISRQNEAADTVCQESELHSSKEMSALQAQVSEVENKCLDSEEGSKDLVLVKPEISSGTETISTAEENSSVFDSIKVAEEQNPSSVASPSNGKVDDNSTRPLSTSSPDKDNLLFYPDYEDDSKVEEESTLSSFEKTDLKKTRSSNAKDEEGNVAGCDTSSKSDVSELVDGRVVQLESKKSKRMGKKKPSSMKPLELAEELERTHASSGLHWEEGVAAQPMRLEGIRRGPPAVGYLQIDPNNVITRTISSAAFRRDHGSAQVIAVHVNFIAVGMSKGLVLVVASKYSAHHADDMDTKLLFLGSQGDKSHSPVTSMCFNQQGDLLLVGFGDGHLTVWDVQKAAVVKVITGEHTAPVVHTLFLGQDGQVTRQFKAVTGDCKGLVLLHTFSVVPLLNRVSIKTQCLLDGQKTGMVLSASPLLIDISGGALTSAQGNATASPSGIGSMMGGVVGGVVGGDAGWKLFSEGSSLAEEGVVIFVTHQTALVVRLTPSLEVYAQLPKPDGVREGSMPYTAWKYMKHTRESTIGNNISSETLDKASLLAIAWDRKVQVAKLVKSELKVYKEWTLDSAAIGVAWLDDQMLVVLTSRGHLCLFAKEGTELHRSSFSVDGSEADDLVIYHTYLTNLFGNPEKAYNNSVAVRGATIYILGPMQLVTSRLLPWKERIQVLRKAGDWMGALDMAMRLYDGHAHGVIDLPRTIDAIREAIMPYLVELVLLYVDEVFSYISVAFCNQLGREELVDDPKSRSSSAQSEMGEQFARVGGVAVEFCVHIKRIDILFDEIFSKFVAAQHGGTFLELLEPYILKDMLGCLPPEIMQGLVEHYSSKGWLQRVEQCVLHMDISSLDFNQVVRLCREHGLYGALIYLFNRGLDDYKAPLEELLLVLRNSQRENASAIGYRMLVYLKYCFSGLAFPPGHGTIPVTRVPSVKRELVQFLLEDSSDMISQVEMGFRSPTGSCPNLYHLLWLDSEATLEVLKCAFLEGEVPKSDHGLVDEYMEDSKESDEKNKINQNQMVQVTVNSLVQIIDYDASEVDGSATDDTGSLEAWPSKKDIGHLLEFIAFFVASERATVSKSVLNHILEHFTFENNFSLPSQKVDTPKKGEKQVLALLKVVPETDWDSSYVLHLCEKAQLYQVCGLIYALRGQYVSALDNYMKDVEEPIHAFSFITKMLLQLRDTEFTTFQSAVISRIPELLNLSREGTFFLVIDHFSKETQQILSELRPHLKSLFLYLKTTIEVHLSGTLDFSALKKGIMLDITSGRGEKDQPNDLEAYLRRLSDFPKLLRHYSVNVTDEIVELYVELLCQFERSSVLKFLETFESYRLEQCLRLCQEYEVIDAAAFLLERVGDVGSALLLTLSSLNEKFKNLDAGVQHIVSDTSSCSLTEMEQLNSALRIEEVSGIRDVLHAAIGLCQRNTLRLVPEESESLWFRLLDSFCEPLKDSYDDKTATRGNHVGTVGVTFVEQDDKEEFFDKWRLSKSNKGAHIFRKVFSQFIKEIVEGMIGYVRLPTIMGKLLSDNGGQEFGDFKLTILGMLGTYGFERRILDTAKTLIEDDTFYTMSLLKKGACHGYAPQSLLCCICNSPLTKKYSTSGIRVFSCGHATHLQCEFQENETFSSDFSSECPVCLPKKKTQRSKNKFVLSENGLVKNSSRMQPRGTTTLQHAYESDVADKPYGLQQISRFEILNNLQKSQKSFQLENLPQLKLAPPTVYHEKVKKTVASTGEASSSLTNGDKANKNRHLKDLKMKGTSMRFPLRSSIFGNEKTKKR